MNLYLAILGPDEEPNCKVTVQVLRAADTPGFYHCETEAGSRLLVHVNKLRRITPSPVVDGTGVSNGS